MEIYWIPFIIAFYLFLVALVAVIYVYWENTDDPPTNIRGDYPNSFFKE